ncbi:MAG: hypothetical protein N3E37_05070, partial [Candidatus Micrarchaeota archaeon]|nr:hypothetical protein [Candidatus Micrarchaeota archaeon]
ILFVNDSCNITRSFQGQFFTSSKCFNQPEFSPWSINSTYAGEYSEFNISVIDPDNLTGYEFFIDNGINEFISLGYINVPNLIDYDIRVIYRLNDTIGARIRGYVTVNDSCGSLTNSSIFEFDTTKACKHATEFGQWTINSTLADSDVNIKININDTDEITKLIFWFDDGKGTYTSDVFDNINSTNYTLDIIKRTDSVCGALVRFYITAFDYCGNQKNSTVGSFTTTCGVRQCLMYVYADDTGEDDGYVEYHVPTNTYTRNNSSLGLKVGSAVPWFYRSYVEFNTSNLDFLKDQINQINLSLFVADHGVSSFIHSINLYNLSKRPSGSTNEQLFVDSGDGPLYSMCFNCNSTGFKNITLNTQGIREFNNLLDEGWFGIGIYPNVTATSYVVFNSSESLFGTYRPTLIISYNTSNICFNENHKCDSSPVFSFWTWNTTRNGSDVLVNINATDDDGIVSFRLWFDNGNGFFTNDGWISNLDRDINLSIVKRLTSSCNKTIRFVLEVNDSCGNLVNSSIGSFKTTCGTNQCVLELSTGMLGGHDGYILSYLSGTNRIYLKNDSAPYLRVLHNASYTERSVAFLEFNTSLLRELINDINITEINLTVFNIPGLYLPPNNPISITYIYDIQNRPSMVNDNQTLFNDACNGSLYGSGSLGGNTPSYVSFSLFQNALDGFKSTLRQGWFALGICSHVNAYQFYVEDLINSSDILLDDYKPKLIIFYNTTRDCVNNLTGNRCSNIPMFSSWAWNSTVNGSDVNISINVSDLDNVTSYRLWFDNGTGVYVADSWVSNSPMDNDVNFSIVRRVNSTCGSSIRFILEVNDSCGNRVNSSVGSFTTTCGGSGWGNLRCIVELDPALPGGEDGYVISTTYSKIDSLATLSLMNNSGGSVYHRAYLQFNSSYLPSNIATINHLNLSITLNSIVTGVPLLHFYNFSAKPSSYSNYQYLYEDAGNGTYYGNDSSFVFFNLSSKANINLSSAITEFMQLLPQKWFGIGIVVSNLTNSYTALTLNSSENTIVSSRPKLIVYYNTTNNVCNLTMPACKNPTLFSDWFWNSTLNGSFVNISINVSDLDEISSYELYIDNGTGSYGSPIGFPDYSSNNLSFSYVFNVNRTCGALIRFKLNVIDSCSSSTWSHEGSFFTNCSNKVLCSTEIRTSDFNSTDGYVYYNTVNYLLYNTTPILKANISGGMNTIARAYLKFSTVSFISPNLENIIDVNLTLNISDMSNYNISYCQLFDLLADPLLSSNVTIYNDAGNGTYYGIYSECLSPGIKNFSLKSPTLLRDIKNFHLTKGWFGIGIGVPAVLIGLNNYVHFDSAEGVYPPTLRIVYYTTDNTCI